MTVIAALPNCLLWAYQEAVNVLQPDENLLDEAGMTRLNTVGNIIRKK